MVTAMEEIIREMLVYADANRNQSGVAVAEFAKRIIDELARTINAPFPWREIGENLARDWNNGTLVPGEGWLWDVLDLSGYGADECYGVAAMED